MLKLKKIHNYILKYIIALFVFDVVIIFILEMMFDSAFALIPYFRLLIIIFTFLFFFNDFLLKKIQIDFKKTQNEDFLVLFWCFFTLIEFILGVLYGNPKIYIVADFVYIFFGGYLFLIISNRYSQKPIEIKDLNAFIKWLLLILYSLIFFNINISASVFIIVLSLSYVLLIQKKYTLFAVTIIPFFIQIINSNRALLICFLSLAIIYGIYRLSFYIKKKDRLLLLFFISLFLLVFYQELIALIFNLIPEGTELYSRMEQLLEIINKGIDFENSYHTSIAQRLVEAKVVIGLWLSDFWSFLFGCGLGSVIDGKLFIDGSVTKTALLGSKSIHNIHFLPFALIHKYGLLGLIVFGMLIIELINSVSFIVKRRNNTILVFWNILFVMIFIYSLPAASFLWASPIFWIALAMKKKDSYE